MKRASISRMSLAVTLCGALSLTACSSGGASAPDATSAPAGTTRPDASTDAPDAVSAAKLCDYLRGRLPELKAIGSEVGAMSNLTVNLYSWYEKQGHVPDGGQIDRQLQKECPDVQDAVLKVSGMRSFATL
ncbi:hypothetical protein AB0D67_23880 [Streptosporangium sp. NPDC048047]|uniref:hypothetical protein n=1 Tax=Streptosporangium sp. NPDC048047 TaxID=3155748 RepID=UPI00341FDFBD